MDTQFFELLKFYYVKMYEQYEYFQITVKLTVFIYLLHKHN